MTAARRFLAALAAVLPLGLPATHAQTVPTYAAADLVLGQDLFTTNTSASPANASSLATPNGIAVDPVSEKVFVADSANNRVLRYASQATLANGATPEIVIGQLNFSASNANQGNAACSQTSLSNPSDVFVDASGRLWIADTGNNRVLLFENAANLFNTPFADRVYGQPDFVTSTAAATQAKLASPNGVSVDPNGVLWVADTGSHRVMAWKNAANLTSGSNADRVLGQGSFTSNAAATSQSGLFNPRGIATDTAHVWVADSGSNRVVMYANFPAINGAPANLVLGQKDYVSSTPATSATGMTSPTSVALADATLYVADSGNNRVLQFLGASDLTPGATADGVIGQSSFTSGTSGISSQRIALFYSHVSTDAAGDVFVADTLNNRALRFSVYIPPTPTPTPVPSKPPTVKISAKPEVFTAKTIYTLRGTASGGSGGIQRISYNLNNQGYLFAKGTKKWNVRLQLRRGRNKVVVYAVDKGGKLSKPKSVLIFRQ